MMHLIKEVTKGLATTKCGLKNQSLFGVTVWWKDSDCPECVPYEWRQVTPADGGAQVGKKMVAKTYPPMKSDVVMPGTIAPPKRRKIVRVAE